jgi:hypothetical protein
MNHRVSEGENVSGVLRRIWKGEEILRKVCMRA